MNYCSINIPRGTTFDVPITIVKCCGDGEETYYSSTDTVVFGVKKSFDDTDYIIKKTAVYDSDNKYYMVSIEPDDTKNLDFERYWYDVGLQTADGKFYQIIPASPFNVRYVVTSKE